jgi:hypothetical protein
MNGIMLSFMFIFLVNVCGHAGRDTVVPVVQPQVAPEIHALALHLIAFTAHHQNAVSNKDVETPSRQICGIIQQHALGAKIKQLQLVGTMVDLARNMNAMTTNARRGATAINNQNSSSSSSSSSSVALGQILGPMRADQDDVDVNRYTYHSFMTGQVLPRQISIDIREAAHHLLRTMSPNVPMERAGRATSMEYNAAQLNHNLFAHLCTGLNEGASLGALEQRNIIEHMMTQNAVTYGEAVHVLEIKQINTLRDIDRAIGVSPQDTTVRCLTWIVTIKAGEPEQVFAPCFTCVQADGRMHFMLYNDIGISQIGRAVLKLVVGNFLCEIPYEVQKPPHLISMAVLVIAEPVVSRDQSTNEIEIAGVKVCLYNLASYNEQDLSIPAYNQFYQQIAAQNLPQIEPAVDEAMDKTEPAADPTHDQGDSMNTDMEFH